MAPWFMKKGTMACLFLAAVLLPWNHLKLIVHGVPFTGYEIAVILAVLTGIITRKERAHKEIVVTPFWIVVLLLLVAVGISVLPAGDHLKALGILKAWFVIPILMAGLLVVFSDKNAYHTIVNLLWIDAIICAVWGIGQALGIIQLMSWQAGDPAYANYLIEVPRRAFAGFDSPNFLAMWLVPLLFLKVWEKTGKRWLWFEIVSCVVVIGGLWVSHSQAGFLTLLSGLALVGYSYTKKTPAWRWGVSLVTLLAVCIGIFVSLRSDSGGSAVRLDIYHYSLRLLFEHPIWGIGLGAFQQAVGRLAANSPSFIQYGLPYALHPHNIFLAFWLNTGILGFIAFLILIGLTFRRLSTTYRVEPKAAYALSAAFVTILVHGLFDTTYFYLPLAGLFWILMGIIRGYDYET
jgi:O-antigen ligase